MLLLHGQEASEIVVGHGGIGISGQCVSQKDFTGAKNLCPVESENAKYGDRYPRSGVTNHEREVAKEKVAEESEDSVLPGQTAHFEALDSPGRICPKPAGSCQHQRNRGDQG